MTKQEIKDELMQIRFRNKHYEEKIKEYKRYINRVKDIETLIDNIHGRISTFEVNKLKKIHARLIVKRQQVLDEINNLKIHEEKSNAIIEGLSYPYKLVLYYRYFAERNFDEIASLLHYTDKRIYQFHAKAIEMLVSR